MTKQKKKILIPTSKEKETLGKKLIDTHEQHIKQDPIESGDLVNSFGPKYMKSLITAARNHSNLTYKFYIQVISEHLPKLPNRGLYIRFFVRKSLPIMEETHDVWSYDPKTENLELEWSLPHRHEMKNFLRAPEKYSSKLIYDIKKYLNKN